jgi:hypothetical protein
MSVRCAACAVDIETPPKMPFSVLQENGKPVIATDYTPVYEHIRDMHPEQWTDALAAEFKLRLAR